MDTVVSKNKDESAPHNSNTGKILGGLIGGAVGVALICAILCYVVLRRQGRYNRKKRTLQRTKVRFNDAMLEKELDLPVFAPPVRAAQSVDNVLVPAPPPPRT